MRLAKPLLLVLTPIGVAGAIFEAFRQAGGLGFLLVALLLFVGAALGMVVMTIREERRGEEGRAGPPPGAAGKSPGEPTGDRERDP